jgi:hypothetical protein
LCLVIFTLQLDVDEFRFLTYLLDAGSSYGNTTTTYYFFRAFHNEDDSSTVFAYATPRDLAQSTDFSKN